MLLVFVGSSFCVHLSSGFVEKNKDQIHEAASDRVQFSHEAALHKAYEHVELAQKLRAEALTGAVGPASGVWYAVQQSVLHSCS